MYQTYDDYWLAHHGILNQRWGVRNGPPYPLGSDISTGHRLREGAAGKPTVKKDPKTTKVNKQIKAAAKSGLGFKVKTREYTIEEDAKAVNPKFNKNLHDWEQPEYHTNCCWCAATFEMRRRGYDVQARPRINDKEYHDLVDYYLNPNEAMFDFKGERRTKEYGYRDTNDSPFSRPLPTGNVSVMVSNVKRSIKAMPDGSRGTIDISWYCGGGHIINFEKVDDNNMWIIDSQQNLKWNMGGSNDMWSSGWLKDGNLIYASGFGVTRLDDVDVIPGKIKGACK